MILHLLPVRGAANDIFSQATSLLVVTPVDRAVVPTAKVLQGLFDLTPAEARVARGIGEAQTVEALALSAGVSIETVRSQLKAVLSKTGLSRQQELINLLAGNMLPGVQNSSLSLTGRMERPKMPSKFSMLFIFAADRGLFIFPSDGKSFCLSWS
jgi:DNA-binding CsgD family transcriptional regulator